MAIRKSWHGRIYPRKSLNNFAVEEELMNVWQIFGPYNNFLFYNVAVGPLFMDYSKPRAAP